MAEILVIRLSAIGDVAMAIPVVYSAAKANPRDRFTMLTQDFLVPVFVNPPPNLKVMGIDIRGKEKSLGGLLRFAKKLAENDFDIVLDLHQVIRSCVIRSFFRLKGKKVFVIDKAGKERTRLTARQGKILKPLRPVTERYADVFRTAGLACTESFRSLFGEQPAAGKEGKWIGIAPFAKHEGKIYPPDKMQQVVTALAGRDDVSLFLFGAKGGEAAILEQWASRRPNVRNIAGSLSLSEELALINQLDVMVSMDSANMHLASLVDTPVVSVWGATHPFAGFYGYRQKPGNAVQLNLDCRPCSIYGNRPCFRGDHACMTQLPPRIIIQKTEEILSE